MHHKITRFSQNESPRLNDALIRMEISYLDSTIAYRDSLPADEEARRHKLTFGVNKTKAAKYGAIMFLLLLAIAGLSAIWFCVQ